MEFIDLKAQYRVIKDRVLERIAAVLERGDFILGSEVSELETRLGSFVGDARCVCCSDGTDALYLALLARGVGVHDWVIVPTYSFFATAEAVSMAGATPVFADVDQRTFNTTESSVRQAYDRGQQRYGAAGFRGVISVSLFGQMPDLQALERVVQGLNPQAFLIEDAAQSFGSSRAGRASCNATAIATTSFFPAKPLGGYGDGGAVFCQTEDDEKVLRSLRAHGQGAEKYTHVRLGLNSRLDTIQAAILLEKLALLSAEVTRRNEIAALYTRELHGHVITPHIDPEVRSSWAQYTIKVPSRDRVRDELKARGIPTMIYYPTPLHLQRAYHDLGWRAGDLPNAERCAQEALSLPFHPYLDEQAIERIVEALKDVLSKIT